MATKRSYHDACGMAHALDLVGERWGLLVIRELLLGPKRYTDLRADLPGISTNMLADRLEELESAGVLIRRRLPPPAGSRVYELTAWGAELEGVIMSLGRWGARSPARAAEAQLSVNSVVLSLRTNFDEAAARGVAIDCALLLGEHRFAAVVGEGRFSVVPGEIADPRITIETDPLSLAGLLYADVPLPDAVAQGTVRIEGPAEEVQRFLNCFALPEPVAAPA